MRKGLEGKQNCDWTRYFQGSAAEKKKKNLQRLTFLDHIVELTLSQTIFASFLLPYLLFFFFFKDSDFACWISQHSEPFYDPTAIFNSAQI